MPTLPRLLRHCDPGPDPGEAIQCGGLVWAGLPRRLRLLAMTAE